MSSVSLVDGHIDEPKMTNDVAKAIDILEKMDFFQGQRAGRELWFDKPSDIQDKDIECFVKDIAFLKDLINRQKAEIERLQNESIKRIRKLTRLIYDEEIAEAKAEVRKELAEKVDHLIATNIGVSNQAYRKLSADIKNFLKEMDGDNNV